MRWLVSWALYTLGDWVCRVMELHDRLSFLYPVYNRLMGWSHIVQGPSGNGPWDALTRPNPIGQEER